MSRPVAVFVALLATFWAGSAFAQSAGPDEAIKPNGTWVQQLELTSAQKNAIYNTVIRERVRTADARLSATVGATVPAVVELRTLPDQAAAENPGVPDLKYAMVGNDVVVVDPVSRRVIGVIHDRSR
jgi:hypothetical protein